MTLRNKVKVLTKAERARTSRIFYLINEIENNVKALRRYRGWEVSANRQLELIDASTKEWIGEEIVKAQKELFGYGEHKHND